MENVITTWVRWANLRLRRGRSTQRFFMLMTAIVVGLLGGLGTILLHELIDFSHEFFFNILRPWLADQGMGYYALVSLPARDRWILLK